MSVTYDWSPVFGAIQNYAQKSQYQKLLDSMAGQLPGYKPGTPGSPGVMGTPPIPASTTSLDPTLPQLPGGPMPQQAPPVSLAIPGSPGIAPTAPVAPTPETPSPLAGLLKMAGPEAGLPLLLNLAFRQHKYGDTPQYDQNGNAYVLDDQGNQKYLPGVKARDKVDVSNGVAYDPYETPPGAQVGTRPPRIAGGMISTDEGKTWSPIPGYTAQAKSIAEAHAEAVAANRAPKVPKLAGTNGFSSPASLFGGGQ